MSSRLYIGNIGPWATEGGVRDWLVGRGFHVLWVEIVLNRSTGFGRGFAFASLAGDRDAVAAIAQLPEPQLGGRPLVLRDIAERYSPT